MELKSFVELEKIGEGWIMIIGVKVAVINFPTHFM